MRGRDFFRCIENVGWTYKSIEQARNQGMGNGTIAPFKFSKTHLNPYENSTTTGCNNLPPPENIS